MTGTQKIYYRRYNMSTPNYDLPIFTATSIPSWLVDWNGAMNKIDSALATINSGLNAAETNVTALQGSVSTLNQNFITLNNNISSLTADINMINSDLTFAAVTTSFYNGSGGSWIFKNKYMISVKFSSTRSSLDSYTFNSIACQRLLSANGNIFNNSISTAGSTSGSGNSLYVGNALNFNNPGDSELVGSNIITWYDGTNTTIATTSTNKLRCSCNVMFIFES